MYQYLVMVRSTRVHVFDKTCVKDFEHPKLLLKGEEEREGCDSGRRFWHSYQ